MNIKNKHQTISYKFVKNLTIALFPFVVVVTIFNMVVEYKFTKDDIVEEMKLEYSSFAPSLQHSMWILDHKGVENISKGILNSKIITKVVIVNQDDEVIFDSSINQEKSKKEEFSFESKIVHNDFGEFYFLGKIFLYSDTQAIYERLKVGWYMLVLNTFIKFFGLVLLIIFTFNRLLNKTLFELIGELENIEFNKLDKKLTKQEKDSLEVLKLKSSFNNMIQRIKQSKTELIDLNLTLEQKVKERTKELEEKNKELECATKEKSKFLANMSHEIRTPMNGIIGMSYLAMQSTKDQKQEKYLQTINSSANLLLNIINDILDFSKIEAGKLEINKIDFNLQILLREKLNIVEFQAKEKGLELYIIYPPNLNFFLYGDDIRITQVLINLINNAIKFTNSGYVKIYIENTKGDIYTFKVEDSGIGMSEEFVKNLFKPFNQADGTTTRKYGGTGLGLSISKELIELMGGKIWVESKINLGSTFYFNIPLPKAKHKIKTKNIEKLTKKDINILSGSKILLVEDNKINQEIVLGLLEESQIDIDIANNGEEALNLYNQNKTKYELILMDLQMPIIDGYEATKRIREINNDIPIIALSANAMKEQVEKTKKLNMQEHLTKPIEVENLYKTLLKYIKPKITQNSYQKKDTSKKDNIDIPKFINIDSNIGLSHTNQNKKLYLKIIDDFYKEFKFLKLENLDEVKFKRVVHTLKGLSANIGAMKLHNIIKELEENNNQQFIENLEKELKIILEDIESNFINKKEYENSTFETINKTQRDELFNKLKEVIQTKKVNRCEPIIKEISKYKLNNKDKELFNKIKECVDNYDFKSAINITKNI